MKKRLTRGEVDECLLRNSLDCEVTEQGDAFVVTVRAGWIISHIPGRDLARAAFINAENVIVSDDYWPMEVA